MTDLGDVERSLERLFRLAMGRKVHSRQTERVGASVSRAGYAVLRTLDAEGSQAMGELARACSMDPAVAARQVAALERDRLVRRDGHGADGRVRVVELTPEGRDVYRRIVGMRTAFLGRVLDGWTATEREHLAEVVDRLVDDLQHVPFGTDEEEL